MLARVSPFWLPRAGHGPDEYEDAFYPRRNGPRIARRLRFAVADGASESFLSGRWADVLVRSWCRSKRRRPSEVVAAAMAEWAVEVATYVERRGGSDRPLEWFEEVGLAKGAHATLLGLELVRKSREGGRWMAMSMGDTCLFQVRDDQLITSFPMSSAADFSTTPKLISTRPHRLPQVLANIDTADGDWRPGDALFLATDAVAAWFLGAAEAGEAPWKTLSGFGSHEPEAFATWVGEQRDGRHLRNDDVTLVRVDMEGP